MGVAELRQSKTYQSLHKTLMFLRLLVDRDTPSLS